MVTDKSLPEGLVLSDMPKGTEFTAKVIGEDDNRGDRIRIYWVGDEPIELIARPPQRNVAVTETDTNQAPETTEVDGSTDSNTITSAETRTPPTALSRTEVDPALEERFGIGGESPVKIRIDKVMLRRGLLLGRILASDDSAEEFPHRVGIHRRFIPDTLKKARFKGAIVQTTVVRADTAKLRYDATAEFTIITPAPESKQATPSVSANELSGDSTDEHASSSPVDNIQEPAHQPVEITDDQTNVGSQADSPPPTQSLDNDAKPTTEATESDD